MIFVFLCLSTLSLVISSSIHVAANGVISLFFLQLNNISFTQIPHFFHFSVDGH